MSWQNIIVLGMAAALLSGCSWLKKSFSNRDVPQAQSSVMPAPVRPKKIKRKVKIYKPDPDRDSVVLYYRFKATSLNDKQKMNLHDIVESLKANPELSVTIEGHTDDRGSREFNIILGERRAKMVKRHLKKRGVSEKQMLLVSFGEERPVTNSLTEKGRDLNRRVEVVLKKKKTAKN